MTHENEAWKIERAALLDAIELLTQAERKISQLEQALTSRIVIEQAKGWLACRAGVGTDEAFFALRRYSRDRNLKLATVAAELLSSALTDLDGLVELARRGGTPAQRKAPAPDPAGSPPVTARC